MKKLFGAFFAWLKDNGWDLGISIALVACLVTLSSSIKQGTSAQPPATSGPLKAIVGEQAILAALERSLSAGATVYVGVPFSYRSTPESAWVERLELIDAALKNVPSGTKPTIVAPSAHALYDFLVSFDRDSRNAYPGKNVYPGEYEAKLRGLMSKANITSNDREPYGDCGLIIQSPRSTIVPMSCVYRTMTAEYIDFYYPGIVTKATAELQNSDPDIQAALTRYNDLMARVKASPERSNYNLYPSFSSYAGDLISQKENLLIYFETTDPFLIDKFKETYLGPKTDRRK